MKSKRGSSSGSSHSSSDKSGPYRKFFQGVLYAARKSTVREPNVEWRLTNDHGNWVVLHSVESGVWYGVGFTEDRRLRVDLHLKLGTPEETRQLYGALHARRHEIEDALRFHVEWESPEELGTGNGRLAVYESGNISDHPVRLAELQAWAAGRIVAMRAVLSAHLDELLSQPRDRSAR